MPAPDLKPCPFCGASDLTVGYGPADGRLMHVVCLPCNFGGPPHMDAATAVLKWNSRLPLLSQILDKALGRAKPNNQDTESVLTIDFEAFYKGYDRVLFYRRMTQKRAAEQREYEALVTEGKSASEAALVLSGLPPDLFG